MILALRALGIGDLATVVPALRGLRAAHPGERLVLAAPRWLAPLVALIEAVDALDPTDGLTPRPWPQRPRLAVNLHGSGPQSHALLAGARPATLWAFAAQGFPCGPSWSPDDHEVRRWCRLMQEYGVPADPSDLDLPVPPAPSPGPRVTIVHPGAKASLRRWPPIRYAAVARALRAGGHHVVITGSATETDLATTIAAEAGLPEEAVLAGRLGLGETAGLVAHALLLISGDTGIAHLATAFRTPSVVLFGPMSPARWGPPADRPYHQPIWHGRDAEPGDGPGEDPHPALLAITVTEVVEAAADVLSAARRVTVPGHPGR